MTDLTVYKLDEIGREVWQYPATLLERTRSMVKLEAPFNRDDMDLGYTTFARGDRFVEYFYSDRWYNLFAIYDRRHRQAQGLVRQHLPTGFVGRDGRPLRGPGAGPVGVAGRPNASAG